MTLARYPGLEIRRKIPCQGHKGKECPYEFDHQYLERVIEKKNPSEAEVECQETLEKVSACTLLAGIQPGIRDKEFVHLLQEHEKSSQKRHRETTASLRHVQESCQREFLNIYMREQRMEENSCPNIFILSPKESNWLKKIFQLPMTLQVFCQCSKGIHPPERDGKIIGRFSIKQPRKWLRVSLPYLQKAVEILRWGTLLAPTLSVLSSEWEKQIKNEISLMVEMVKKLPELQEARFSEFQDKYSEWDYTGKAKGPQLRALKKLLIEVEPDPDQWGLFRKITPEGHVFWLCEKHYDEFDRF